MAFGRALATNVSPLLLRIAIGTTFLFAGSMKLFTKSEYDPASTALLANLGVSAAENAAVGAAPTTTPTTPAKPAEPLPEPTDDEEGAPAGSGAAGAPGEMVLVRQAATTYTADQFAGPTVLRGVYGIALMVHGAAYPADPAAKAIMPRWAGDNAVLLAWMAGVTEFVGGLLVLIGLFTRLSGFSLACVMVVAMWLTQIGPNLGTGLLGFLPRFALSQHQTWSTFVEQLTFLMIGLSLLLTGAGAISLDGLLFGRGRSRGRASSGADDDADDDE